MADVSIIVPIYNAEKYLNRCIDSLINQTKKELEFILINDGSTDSSEEIIKSYSDKRIKYYKNKNQGIGKTRNFGIEKAKSDYIMFLDSDDYLEYNACEKLYEKISSENLDLVICDYYKVYENGTKEDVKVLSFENTTLKEKNNILLDINLAPWNKIYKLDLIKKNNIKFVENLKYEDAPFVSECLDKAKKIGKVDLMLNAYVIHNNSETTIRDKRIFDIIKIVDNIRKIFKNKKYMSLTVDKLTVRILTNYTIQQRMQEDKKVAMQFIDEAFNYLQENVPDYKNNKYYENRGFLRRTIEKNKFLSKAYCSIYKKKQNFNNFLVISLYSLMTIIFSYIIFNIFFNNENYLIRLNFLQMILGTGIYTTLIFCLTKFFKYKKSNMKHLFIITSILFLIVQLIFAYFFAVTPSWDFGDVFHTCLDHINGKIPLYENSYYYKHSNNLALGIMLTSVLSPLKLVGITNPIIYGGVGILLNILCIDVSLLYLYKILKLYFKEENIKVFWILTLLFTPFITYIPIFYTDTISLPFATAGIYYLLQMIKNNKIKDTIYAALFLGIGTNIKFSLLIILIAFLIFYPIFIKINIKEKIIKTIILILVFLIPIISLNIYKTLKFDQKKLDKESFPITHHIMMGLNNKGGYSKEDSDLTKSIPTKQKKQEYHLNEIKIRINKLINEKKIMEFYTGKVLYTWGDGTFFATAKLSEQPVHKTPIHKYILPSNKENLVYTIIAQSQLIITLLFITIGMIFRKYLSKDQKQLQLFLNIIIFGFLLFLIIWETRSRYIVNIIPVLLLASYLGIIALNNKIKKVDINV